MDSYRWDEIQRLYHAALERPPGERAGFLEVACGEDSELRREVESLLAYEGQADELLEHSPWLPGETVETCAAGTKLGAYKVVRLLGRGGMGEVYLAEDPRLKRQVAIKALRHARTVTEQERARFLLEARAASALNHPNIVTVYDVLAEGGCDFIVMEYIPGGTLADRIARKALRLKQSLEIGARIADALACAHGAGIVHRDLKPSNVMIADDGAVKVLDFGVAKITRAGKHQDSGSTLTPPQTGAGVVVGTSGYMSPEQVCGRPVDHRSDIFSFALVLYEMLAGRRAFQGDSSFELMNAILKEEPPELPESVPPALRSLIGDCLAKDPAARFESARDLAFALRAFSTGSGASAGSLKIEEAPRRSLARWLMAAVAIVPAIVAAALYVTRPEPLDLSKYGFKPVATEAELESAGTWSPDGKSIAYLKNDIEGQRQVMVRALDAPSARQLTRLPAGIDGLPFFSPDGDHVYFIFSGSLRSVAVVGGDAREVLKGPMAAAAISPDGKTLAVWRSYEEGGKRHASVWISSPPGSTPRQYQPAPFRTEGSFVPDYVRFSPDGSKIGVAAWRRPAEAWMWLLPWPDGPNARPRQVLSEQGFRAVPSFDWMPDSRHLCFASGGLWLGDTRSGKCTRLTAFAAGVAALPSVSRDGRRVLFALSSSDLDVVEFPLDGSSLRPFIATTRNELSPSWSRSGDEMTYITDRSGEPEIWLRNMRTGWERPIVRQADFPNEPQRPFPSVSISPDGTRIGYLRHGRLWVSAVSGGRPSLADAAGEPEAGIPSWSPDGSSLAYLARSRGKVLIGILRVGAQQPPYLIPETEAQCRSAPVWSPDGQWIACGGAERTVLLVSPDGSRRRRLASPTQPTHSDFVLMWSPDAAAIYVISALVAKPRLDSIDVRTGKSRKIADYPASLALVGLTTFSQSGSVSRDGRSFLTTVQNVKSDLWILEGFPQPRGRWF